MHPNYSPASSPHQQQMGSPYQSAVRGGAGHGHGQGYDVKGHIKAPTNLQQLPPQMSRTQNYSNVSNTKTKFHIDTRDLN